MSDEADRIVIHYAQAAHDRGGGYFMALRMMAEDLLRAREGYPPLYPRLAADATPARGYGDG